ncbi:hypothetical protein HPP92_027691 [Vanilla planifolia]|uniref:Uncharacterized protein n=1 Tax=Vanilla planifolia TaxID=51239 RepID=A0A835U786_VANPL|nr:hypothetical protein HPP92_027691 [Vanilla planifolia]
MRATTRSFAEPTSPTTDEPISGNIAQPIGYYKRFALRGTDPIGIRVAKQIAVSVAGLLSDVAGPGRGFIADVQWFAARSLGRWFAKDLCVYHGCLAYLRSCRPLLRWVPLAFDFAA